MTKLDLLTLEGSCGSSRNLKAVFLRERRLQAQGFGVEIEVLGDDAVQTTTESDGEDSQSAAEMLAAQIASTEVVIESDLLPERATVGADLGEISVEVATQAPTPVPTPDPTATHYFQSTSSCFSPLPPLSPSLPLSPFLNSRDLDCTTICELISTVTLLGNRVVSCLRVDPRNLQKIHPEDYVSILIRLKEIIAFVKFCSPFYVLVRFELISEKDSLSPSRESVGNLCRTLIRLL